MLDNWKNKKVAVLGFGIEGIATAQFLLKNGIEFTVLDRKNEQAFDQAFLQQLKKQKIAFIFGETYLDSLSSFDIIIRSPGIFPYSQKLQDAQQKGAIITSHTQIFFDVCPCPIIGVTGTKGKGTTSSLIYHMLKKSEKDMYLGGNIGEPPLTFFEKLTKNSVVVLELSSFQLQDLGKSPADAKAMAGKPYIAVVLMITSEHLQAWGEQNYHKDIAEYIDAKRNILRFQTEQDAAVINRDYLASSESDIHTDAPIYFVSRERACEQGCFVKDNAVYLRMDGNEEKIIDTKDILLPGKHNVENVCSAVMAATLAGATKNNIVSVLQNFKGLEHRLQRVAEIDGVTYYDDSFSTTPETAIAAIEAFEQPEILILGGSSKGSDFTQLGKVISHNKNIKAIIGIGEEWEKIKSNFKFQIFPSQRDPALVVTNFKLIEGARSMKEIVLEASEIAEAGDVVLLSPACASFDMFRDYKDRGEQFKKEVKELELRLKM